MRNPVTYVRSPFDRGLPCQCGCGEFAARSKPFVQGHDQTALHDRVRRIGTVADFLRWFDNVADLFATNAIDLARPSGRRAGGSCPWTYKSRCKVGCNLPLLGVESLQVSLYEP